MLDYLCADDTVAIRQAIEQMGEMVQLIAKRGENTTIMFDVLDHRDTCG